jgi:hypothetical protein
MLYYQLYVSVHVQVSNETETDVTVESAVDPDIDYGEYVLVDPDPSLRASNRESSESLCWRKKRRIV